MPPPPQPQRHRHHHQHSHHLLRRLAAISACTSIAAILAAILAAISACTAIANDSVHTNPEIPASTNTPANQEATYLLA